MKTLAFRQTGARGPEIPASLSKLFAATAIAFLLGCDLAIAGVVATEPQTTLTGARRVATPTCPSIHLRALPFEWVALGSSSLAYRNRDSNQTRKQICVGEVMAFQRYLLDGGEWLNEDEWQAAVGTRGANLALSVNVIISWNGGLPPRAGHAPLSSFARAQKFSESVFTKWSASSAEISSFERSHPGKKVDGSPRWTIDETVDDFSGQPVEISCTPSPSFEKDADAAILRASRPPVKGVQTKATGSCFAHFSFKAVDGSHLTIKLLLLGMAHRSSSAIENLRMELNNKLKVENFGSSIN